MKKKTPTKINTEIHTIPPSEMHKFAVLWWGGEAGEEVQARKSGGNGKGSLKSFLPWEDLLCCSKWKNENEEESFAILKS